ncbi:hypothetical protein [Pseudoxanthomonas sp. UTMC 1351]
MPDFAHREWPALVAVIGLFVEWSEEAVVLPVILTALWLASA